MDFFTVPTVRFGVRYCFFVIAHDRRRILHCNVTKVVRQVREAFPFGLAPRFLIFDRDRKYGLEVPAAVRSLGIEAMQTSSESPWQNGVAERRIGSCRREQNRPWIPNRNTSRGACAQAYRRLRYPRYRSPFAYPTPRAGKKGTATLRDLSIWRLEPTENASPSVPPVAHAATVRNRLHQ